MNHLTYSQMISENDPDIPSLLSVFRKPEIACFYSVDRETYFSYVTHTANVYFYKVYRGGGLVGVIHLEKQDATLFLSILVLPEYQRAGVGTRILKDVLDDGLGLDFRKVEVFIDEKNTASRRLFEKLGFDAGPKDEELIRYSLNKA